MSVTQLLLLFTAPSSVAGSPVSVQSPAMKKFLYFVLLPVLAVNDLVSGTKVALFSFMTRELKILILLKAGKHLYNSFLLNSIISS